MVLVQVFTVAMLLLSKLALNTGMRPFVLIVYRNLIAAAAVAPLALIFEREMWKKLNLVVGGWILLNATFGVVLAMGLYYYGLQATSATYSANFLNLIPIVTFVIAVVLRSEKLALGKWPGKMKLLGALLCVGGTMVVSLIKGRLLHLWPAHLLKYSHTQPPVSATGVHRMVAGTLFLCGSCLSYALWFIVQVRLAKVFPSRYWATMLTCLLGSLQSFVIGILLSHDRDEWKLNWDLQLLTVVYSGVFNTGITFVLISWVISRRGPIYPPMFNSLSLIITTIMDSVLLGTNIYLGSVLGTLLVIVGLYAFLWGKGKELQLAAAAKKQEAQQRRQGGDEMA
ncbi:WAT1-related protein At5g64700-like [Phragmites australis]|uniref:WAT1-related protein At5g64700-like n=1 Tax=Phragmites australis TaxID=29695 RepID=UPI002D76E4B3|nr:WAT1-related protein At5g64700-like [Phragmites australis]